MSKVDIIRALRDEEYRMSLREEQRAALPENPAGFIELEDAGLEIKGGRSLICTMYTRQCDSICVVFSC